MIQFVRIRPRVDDFDRTKLFFISCFNVWRSIRVIRNVLKFYISLLSTWFFNCSYCKRCLEL